MHSPSPNTLLIPSNWGVDVPSPRGACPGCIHWQKIHGKRGAIAPPSLSSVRSQSHRIFWGVLCSWEALPLSAHSLNRFLFPRILHQPGQIYLLYLSPVMTQLTEIPELGTWSSRKTAAIACPLIISNTATLQSPSLPLFVPPGATSFLLQHYCMKWESCLQQWMYTLECILWRIL